MINEDGSGPNPEPGAGESLYRFVDSIIDGLNAKTEGTEWIGQGWQDWKLANDPSLFPPGYINEVERLLDDVRTAIRTGERKGVKSPVRELYFFVSVYKPAAIPSRVRENSRPLFRDIFWYSPEGQRHAVTIAPDFDQSRNVIIFRREDGLDRILDRPLRCLPTRPDE